ncbi:MAG: sensor histidine kinase [Acidobacteriota bacterium]
MHRRLPKTGTEARAGQAPKLWALRIGFALVIALMAFAAFSAHQVQQSLSEEALGIYRRHVEHDEALYRLRRTIWIGSNTARDFFLNSSAERAAFFGTQIERLRTDSRRLLDDLLRLQGERGAPPELRASVENFWNAVATIPTSAQRLGGRGAHDFIQREIVPRRDAVGEALRAVMENNRTALERNEREFAGTRRSAARRLLVALGLSLFLGLAVAGFSLVFSESLERQAARQYEEVAQARRDLQQLSARLMQIQEEERARLSRELHDEIGQMLATLRLETTRTESLAHQRAPELHQQISGVRELVERMIQIVRNISLLLRPSLLDDLGLGPALQWQVEDFTRRTGVPCEFVEQSLQDALPDAVRTCVYRILQEALHNCEKHASASRVDVSIQQSPGLLLMRVEDNGCGFAADSRERVHPAVRCGLLGMRERAAALGGSVHVGSSPGKGTRVTLRLPLSETGNQEAVRGPAEVET